MISIDFPMFEPSFPCEYSPSTAFSADYGVQLFVAKSVWSEVVAPLADESE